MTTLELADASVPPALVDTVDASAPDRDDDPEVAPGDCLGRYTIRALLGAGGMGQVYSAYDPGLDRLVAVKILKPGLGGSSPEGRARFQREAQAMARLSHPNVVSVFDVGEVGRRVFVAMEIVEGPTLGAWLDGEHDWREIVEVFLQAARGLSAAHAAGIVHRDFKPANVIVGDRVRVVDFGLARACDGEADTAPRAANTLGVAITAAGKAVGTPAYMAPEQRAHAAPSPLSDQYSFALTLGEALTRAHTRGGRSIQIPGWLRTVVARGMARQPADRYPSMREVIDALAQGLAGGRRRWLATATLVAVLAGTLVAAREPSAPARLDPCGGAALRLGGVWDGPRKQALGAAFGATGLAYSADVWRRVSARLDGYTGEWAAMHGEACRATRVEGRQSDALLDLRMACLERRRSVLASLTGMWSRGMTGDTLQNALDAAHDLPPLAECADTRALTERAPLPDDPVLRATIGAARGQVDVAQALWLAHRLPDARRVAASARHLADGTSWAQVRAEAALAEGRILSDMQDPDAEPPLVEAARLASEAHDDRLAATALIVLVDHLAEDQQAAERALLVAQLADGAIARLGNDPPLRARLMRNRGSALITAGRLEEARATFTAAGALFAAAYGPHDLATLGNDAQLARVAERLGQYPLARKLSEEYLAQMTAAVGPEHPKVAAILNNLAMIVDEGGDHEAAAELYRRALSIKERMVGPETVTVAVTLNNLGVVEISLGQLDLAEGHLARALALRERLLGPEHGNVGQTLLNMAIVHRKKGRWVEAQALLARSLAITLRAYGERHAKMAFPLLGLGMVLEAKGDDAGALDYFRRALAVRRAALGDAHPATLQTMILVAHVLGAQGRCAEARPLLAAVEAGAAAGDDLLVDAAADGGICDLAAGKPAEAVESLERALALVSVDPASRATRGAIRWPLARALWSLGRRDAAVRAARQAEADLTVDADAARDLAAVREWLRRRGETL